jgi:hypothetical protein
MFETVSTCDHLVIWWHDEEILSWMYDMRKRAKRLTAMFEEGIARVS